ncbi:hypothetical protein BZA70DRAFT_275299 [Myxozyma melibiosi]|uniref:Life-span regulatory factor domain-containing protein n=1 Tax=Myxozyma melibiosi TaxID=54550 RepID=A0ABR1FAM2_9ASCO
MSFLQYCTVCDKLLTVPSNNILYCSEKCRITDARAHASPSSSPTATPITASLPYARASAQPPTAYSLQHSSSPQRSLVGLDASYSSAMLSKSSRMHPNSIYSASPRSVDLVSPMRIPQPPAPASASTATSASDEFFESTFDVPFMLEKPRPELNLGIGSPHSREGGLKRLFHFSEPQGSS